MRQSMAHLVARLRRLLPDELASSLSDAELCSVLDGSSSVGQVKAHPIRLPWQSSTNAFVAEVGDWEASPTVHDGANTLSVSDFNLHTGEFTLQSPTSATHLFVHGRFVDINAAAAEMLERLAAKQAAQFDFASDDQRFQRSQQVDMLLRMADEYRRKSRPRAAVLAREDVTQWV
jgi:hypothetical protein